MKRLTDLRRAKIREHAVSTIAMLDAHADKTDGPLALFRARDVLALLDDLEDAEKPAPPTRCRTCGDSSCGCGVET